MKRSKRRRRKMRILIRLMCIIGSILFMYAAVTMETHWITSLIWCLIGFVLIAPYLRMTYLREHE